MNVTCIVGSPREKGNCALIAGALVDLLTEHGAPARTYELNKLVYRGCQDCQTCKTTSESCATEDDLSPLLADIGGSDVVVASTPIYFGEVTAQFKSLVDRLYSYLPPDFITNREATRLPTGKQLALIVTQGSPDEGEFGDIVERYQSLFRRLGFEEVYPIRACGVEIGAVSQIDEATMALVRETAAKILGAAARIPGAA